MYLLDTLAAACDRWKVCVRERERDGTRLATPRWSMLWRQFHVVLYPILTLREGYEQGLFILQIVEPYILMYLLKFNYFLIYIINLKVLIILFTFVYITMTLGIVEA